MVEHQLPKLDTRVRFPSSAFLADMAELADAPDLGSGSSGVQVQVLLSACVLKSGEWLYKPLSGFSFFADFVCTCLYLLFKPLFSCFILYRHSSIN